MAKERTLDIFWLLGKLDQKDYQIWDSLTEEQRKEFSPLVTLRWMSGTSDSLQVLLLNELINTTVFSLPDHRELLMKILAVCATGGSKHYKWVNYKTAKDRASKLAVRLVAEHFKLTPSEAADTVKLLSPQELVELAEHQGWQADEIKNLQKELK